MIPDSIFADPIRRTVQLFVANLVNRITKAGPMSEAIAQRGPRSALAIGSSLQFAPRPDSF